MNGKQLVGSVKILGISQNGTDKNNGLDR